MEKRMHSDNVGRLNRLPLEFLQMQILFLLPVKSLMVLRAVNKWFLALIDDPDFVSLHLRHNLPTPEILNFNSWKWHGIQSSVDGIVLLVSTYLPHWTKAAMLYNPSAERKRRLNRRFNHWALGYDVDGGTDKKRYRVLATISDQAWVYSVELDTWTDVTSRSHFRPCDPVQLRCSESLCYSGSVVWTESNESQNSFRLVWFDFGSETFRYSDEMTPSAVRSGIFEMESSTAVGVWKIDDAGEQSVASVWAWRTDTMVWDGPLYNVPQELVPFKEGEVRLNTLRVRVRDGEWESVYWKRGRGRASLTAVWFDLGTHAIVERRETEASLYRDGDVWMGYYVNSLVVF